MSSENHPSLWHHPDFIKFWTGQTISLFGNALSGLAIPLLAAVSLDAAPAEMGLLAAAGSAPSLIIGLFAGVFVDRYRRRSLMILSDIARMVFLATIPAAAFLGKLTITQLYLVGFINGVFSVIYDIAARTYLPVLLARPQLMDGNSKLQLSQSLTAVAGPSLAGVVIQWVTAPVAILLDGFTFLASALFLVFVREKEMQPHPNQMPVITQVIEGLGSVFHSPLLRALAGCLATSNFTSSMFFGLYILFGTRELGLDAAALGLVYGLGSSGAIVGAAFAPRLAKRLGTGWAILLGASIGSVEVLPVVFASPATAIPLLLASSFLGNLGWVLYNVNEISVRQAITPTAKLGRINATFNFLVAGMIPLGFMVGGAVGSILGIRTAIIIAAVGSLFSVLWIGSSPVRKLVKLPETPEIVNS